MSREDCVNLAEQNRLEKKLLENIVKNFDRIENCLKKAEGRRTGYEEVMYRFFYGSQKVFQADRFTKFGYDLLSEMDPKEEKKLDEVYENFIHGALGESSVDIGSRKIVSINAFLYTRYFLEMAAKYRDVNLDTIGRPYGWAALAVLYKFRNLDLQGLIDAEKFNRKA